MTTIGVLRSDNGGEYISSEFESYLKLKGIRHELTVPHTPEQNGVAERMNRTLMESARSMIAHSMLPNTYWAEAVSTAVYLKNRTATTALEKVMTLMSGGMERFPTSVICGCLDAWHMHTSQMVSAQSWTRRLRR